MTSAFSVIEKNQAWDLIPSLVPELALCLHMLHRELNLNLQCIELEYEKANKQMMELRAGFAADLLAQGHSCTVVTTRVTEEYELSRRQARRITAKALNLIVQDFEEINVERPQMVAKLLVNLEQAMQKGLINNQSSGVAACARQIISLAGLAFDASHNNRVRKI
jgi:hypothetical protein